MLILPLLLVAIVEEPSPGFRLPADTRPLEYEIHATVDPKKEGFFGHERIRVHLDTARKTIWLHGRDLGVTEVRVDGKVGNWKQVNEEGLARIALEKPVGPGDVDVDVKWQAKYNASLESVYRVQSEGAWYVFTQFEAISARDGFPCFDEPGFKTPFSLSLVTVAGDTAVANTPAKQVTPLDDKSSEVTFEKTQPLPVYLLAWAVGPFDVVDGKTLPPNALRKDPLPIRGVAVRGKGALMKRSLEVAGDALASLEKYFGTAYPYGKMDIVAVPDFAAGAMENAGLVTFRDSLLFVDDKSPIGLQKGNVFVIAHEFAHQWFGNYVTLAWWDDIWLNEAFASWTEYRTVDEIRPQFHAKTDARSTLDYATGVDSLVSARQIRQPVVSKGDIINAFDGITYDKGASVIAMFESYMGADAFQRGVRAYLAEHAHGTATARDLLAALSKASGKDIATPFSTFLDQPGVPYVQAKLACDKGGARVELTQSRYLPVGSTGDRNKAWQVPVCVRTDKETACTLLTSTTGSLTLKGACPKWVAPNADGLGYYRWALPGDQLKSLSSALKQQTPGERISFGNAARAGFSAGTLLFADALDASLPLARDEEPSVAETPLSFLGFAHDALVDPAARPKVERKIAEAYAPVLADVGMQPKANEDPRVRERRTLALGALYGAAEDPKTTADLAKLGRPVLGLDDDKKTHLDRVHGDLAGSAIAAAVKAGGAAVWDDVAARLTTETDSLTRSYLLGALGDTVDPALAPKALTLALDPRLKINEIFSPLGGQAGDLRTRDAAWAWFPAHYDAVMARLPEEFGGAAVPGLWAGYCTEDKAKEVEAFFGPRKDKVPGMERALAQSLENIRLCAAKKSVQEESARKVFP